MDDGTFFAIALGGFFALLCLVFAIIIGRIICKDTLTKRTINKLDTEIKKRRRQNFMHRGISVNDENLLLVRDMAALLNKANQLFALDPSDKEGSAYKAAAAGLALPKIRKTPV